MSGPLDRRGPCPQCGATIEFPFAAAAARVCPYCRFVVVRTDRAWVTTGRVADLLPLPCPLPIGATATLGAERLRVAGRVQYERQGAASSVWQELFVEYASGRWGWLALAQGRWYATWQAPALPLPFFAQAAPGAPIALPAGATWMVVERGAKRLLSAEGELPFPIRPGVTEWYVDLAGPSGAFATIDYGDGSSAPVLFTGRLVHPSELRVDAGAPPLEPTQVATTALVCPGCGGALPLAAPGSTERVICRYCGTQSDLAQGALVGSRALALPAQKPWIPLGATGRLRGADVVVTGFMIRGTTIEGDRYRWREYLLFVPRSASYVFLLEEDGNFQYIVPIGAGEVSRSHDERSVSYRGQIYRRSQSVEAEVEHVVGEFYWKVEAGERVTAVEYAGPSGHKLNEERDANEVVWSYAEALPRGELENAFGLVKNRTAPGPRRENAARNRGSPPRAWLATAGLFALGWSAITAASCAASRNQVLFDGPVPIAQQTPAGAPAPPAAPAGPIAAPAGSSAARAGAAPADAFFTPVFTIEKDKRSLEVALSSPKLLNTWIGSDIALIRDDTGDVEEASLDLEYYAGVEDGESWSEGSREGDVWFSRIPAGRYLLRIDPAWDPAQPPPALYLRVVHDGFSGSRALLAFGALFIVWIGGWIVEARRA